MRVNSLQPAPLNQSNDRTQLGPDWHIFKRSLQERNAVMLNNELFADVYFLVGSGSIQSRIPAHKYILVTGSSVFYTMFCGGLPEGKEVAIPDVEPQAFLNLLKWVYELIIQTKSYLSYVVLAHTHMTGFCIRRARFCSPGEVESDCYA